MLVARKPCSCDSRPVTTREPIRWGEEAIIRRTLWILPILLFLLSVSAASAAHRASPKDLGLRLSDLPVGFTQTKGRFYTNAQAAPGDHVSVATLNRRGRLLSYESEFQRSALVGIVQVNGTLVAFKSSTGAHWDYARVVANARNSHQMREMSAASVGSERAGFTYTKTANRVSITVDVILFRRKSYGAEIGVAGVTGTFTADQAATLAIVVDRRIQKYG
jgi:hypothetical protein